MPKQAIIYCRFSPRPDADECTSNNKQLDRCIAYCNQRMYLYSTAETFQDKAVSGKRLQRSGLSKALAALKPGMVLVVDTSDRLARDILVNLTIRSQVLASGATIEFADGTPLTNTAEGELFQNLMAAFAQYERRRYSNRTKDGMARKKAAGVWCGRPPIGWRKVKGADTLVPYNPEQHAIEQVHSLHVKGYTSEEIARKIESAWGPCRGRHWSARTIRRLLARKGLDNSPQP